MPPVDRRNPVRASSSESTHSLMEFMREFPDDEACLRWLWSRMSVEDRTHCPKCRQERLFKRYPEARRQSWTCTKCGRHVSPTAGTIYHGSSTSLQLWFYAIFLMSSTRCGISAKQLERELGVTYKTAWRMLTLIRNKLMQQDDDPLSGEVEVDETSVAGKPRTKLPRKEAMQRRERSRVTVFAAVERGGRVRATVLPGRHGPALQDKVIEWVDPTSIIYTDEWSAYNSLWKHFAQHDRIRHSAGEYVVGRVHTNTIEGFFGHLKPAIRGTHRKVSRKWLQGYLNEFCWRYNRRYDRTSMFEALLSASR
jgi:transposase